MKITLETIPHNQQPYDTTGDWAVDGDSIAIRVSDVQDWKSEFLVALHELVEVALCIDRGIPEEVVGGFDIAHPELEDPGDDPRAPYYKEHQVAVRIEKEMAKELGVNWKEHQRRLFNMWTPPDKK